MYVEYIELCTFSKKLCTLNMQNYIYSLKNCVRWRYKIVCIFLKLCIFIQNCDNSLKNVYLKKIVCWIYWIVYILWRFGYWMYKLYSPSNLWRKLFIHYHFTWSTLMTLDLALLYLNNTIIMMPSNMLWCSLTLVYSISDFLVMYL